MCPCSHEILARSTCFEQPTCRTSERSKTRVGRWEQTTISQSPYKESLWLQDL
jgi:hypothetical protein